jgi:hypothetical protein
MELWPPWICWSLMHNSPGESAYVAEQYRRAHALLTSETLKGMFERFLLLLFCIRI